MSDKLVLKSINKLLGEIKSGDISGTAYQRQPFLIAKPFTIHS
jgi:hypothetical protein